MAHLVRAPQFRRACGMHLRLRVTRVAVAVVPSRAFSAPTGDFPSNITPAIASKVGRNLHLIPNHPLNIIKNRIEGHFLDNYKLPNGEPEFKIFDNMDPKVTTTQCFDDMLVPKDHVGRSLSDTFYFDEHHCLRTHTSAHQTQHMRAGHSSFLATGDCFRRDEIDASHYPVFHQMEGVRIFEAGQVDPNDTDFVVNDLKETLEGMVTTIFGDVEKRWVDAYFPFTHPSLELEVFYQGDWLECLGSGVIQTKILEDTGYGDRTGWAFGIGLERLAMVLFGIPDIRLFWTEDPRFHKQFASGQIVKFEPYSKYPPCYKDISLWVGRDPDQANVTGFHENDLSALVREIAGDLVEDVTLIDEFTHPKTSRVSKCYRINYRSLDRSLTNEEVDVLQEQVRSSVESTLDAELR